MILRVMAGEVLGSFFDRGRRGRSIVPSGQVGQCPQQHRQPAVGFLSGVAGSRGT